MKKNQLFATTLLIASLATLSSASVETGQKIYLKACKSCHGNGVKGAAMATQAEWDKWFEKNAASLIDKHKGDPKAAAYFNAPSFKDQMQDLHEFLKEYGSDSGNVPACG